MVALVAVAIPGAAQTSTTTAVTSTTVPSTAVISTTVTSTNVPSTTVPSFDSLRMLETVGKRAEGGFYTIINDDKGVTARLHADRRALADQLIAEFGDRITIILGNFAYPDIAVAAEFGGTLRCGAIPAPGPQNGLVRWNTKVKRFRVHSGGDGQVNVTLTNTSKNIVRYVSTSAITGVVTKPGGRNILAVFPGPLPTASRSGSLGTGESATFSGFVSTASCDRSLGWALPPGRYEIRFVVGADRAAVTPTAQFVSTPFPLTVTNDPPPPLSKRTG